LTAIGLSGAGSLTVFALCAWHTCGHGVREDWVAEKAIDLAMVIRCRGSISELAQAICKPIFGKIGEITGLEERDARWRLRIWRLHANCELLVGFDRATPTSREQ
jgi:hypothetical protein